MFGLLMLEQANKQGKFQDCTASSNMQAAEAEALLLTYRSISPWT